VGNKLTTEYMDLPVKEIKLVTAAEMATLEDYLSSLIVAMASLKTLGAYQMYACEKGILEEDETKVSGYITDSIKSLLNQYALQVRNILDRTPATEEEIILGIRKTMPELDIPHKRKNVKRKN
jgi:hypothetical protein